MKRFLLFLGIGAVAAVAIPYALHVSQNASNAAVASLLPRETLAFAHLPDFNRTSEEWHRSDIYQLYSEPTVQEFLRKPLSGWSEKDAVSQRVREVEQLQPRDAFIALVAAANDDAKFIGGFRFRGNQEAAEQIIATWRARLPGGASKRETIDHQQHQIDIYGMAPLVVASAYDRDWFFISNGTDEIKALLDRADNRVPANANSSLNDDPDFRAAAKEMPSSYALSLYAQPKRFAEKLAATRGPLGQRLTPDQRNALEQVRSVYATTRFDGGKIHDVMFVGLPPSDKSVTLTRDSLGLTSSDTFLYVASVLNFSKQVALMNSGSASAEGVLGYGLGKIATALSRANIDANDWNAAFGSEAGLMADWPKDVHWPSGVVTFPVKDGARARRLAGVIAKASDEDATWTELDRNGVHYLTMQSAPGFLILRPTIAVSNRVMVIGLDPGSVDSAIQRSENSAGGLAKSEAYKSASGKVPAPANFFAYVDLARLYTRFDETLRPILMMWAAFMPGVNDQIDLGRIPSPDIVAKHLSPIVSSQRYAADGYVTESVGPITLNQSGLALVALGVFGSRSGLPNVLGGLSGLNVPQISVPAASPQPSPAQSPTP